MDGRSNRSMKSYCGQYREQNFNERDIDDEYIGWLNDREVNRYLEIRSTRWDRVGALKYYQEQVNNDLVRYKKIIKAGTKIGTVRVSTKLEQNSFDVGYMIGDKEEWGTKAGMAAIAIAMEIGFYDFGKELHCGSIRGANIMARLTAKKMGLVEYKKQCGAYQRDGIKDDIIYVTMDKQKWTEQRTKYIT